MRKSYIYNNYIFALHISRGERDDVAAAQRGIKEQVSESDEIEREDGRRPAHTHNIYSRTSTRWATTIETT